MWIALSIIGFFVWFFKRKTNKKHIPKIIVVFLLIVAVIGICNAQNSNYKIHGKILLPENKGQLYIYLVDKTRFEIPFCGIDTIINHVEKPEYLFTFENVAKGKYGIRCYQDLNDNQKMDTRFFKPTEPWGFSWQNKKKFPFDFEDISFQVNKDSYVEILLEY